MQDTKEIMDTISKYNITEENALSFMLEKRGGDMPHYYYRNMLLELLKNREHLEYIVNLYYGFERGSRWADSITINENGVIKEKKQFELFQESFKKMHNILEYYAAGDNSELQKVIKWAEKISAQIETMENTVPREKWEKLFDELEKLQYLKNNQEKKLQNNSNKIKENNDKIENNNVLLVVEKNLFKRFKNWFEKRKIKKENKTIKNENKEVEKENQQIKQQIKECKKNMEDKSKEIEEFYSSHDAEELGKTIVSKWKYYNGEYPIEVFFNDGYSDQDIKSIPQYFKEFKSDVYSCSKIIQHCSEILAVMQETKDFEKTCTAIRMALSSCNAKTETKIELNTRKRDLNGEGALWSKVPTTEDIPQKVGELSERFSKILAENDETEFVKQCADFHFDFIQVHPYLDGNGRTSRILLSMMLAAHNLILPSIYVTPQEKEEFYVRSNDAINGDYSTIEKDVFERLGHFYPMVLPKIKNKEVETQQRTCNNEDIEK